MAETNAELDPAPWATQCPDCESMISRGAENCPRCGSAELHHRRRVGQCKACNNPMVFAGRKNLGHSAAGGAFVFVCGLGLVGWGLMSAVIIGANLIGLGVVTIGIGILTSMVAASSRREFLRFKCVNCKAVKDVER